MPLDENTVNQIPNDEIFQFFKSKKNDYKEFRNTRLQEYKSDLLKNNLSMMFFATAALVYFYGSYTVLLWPCTLIPSLSVSPILLPAIIFYMVLSGVFFEVGKCLMQVSIDKYLNIDKLMKEKDEDIKNKKNLSNEELEILCMSMFEGREKIGQLTEAIFSILSSNINVSKGLDYYNIKIILGNINGHDALELIEANYKLNSRISGNSHILLLKWYESERDVKKVIFQTLFQLSSQEIKLCLERFNQKSIDNLSDNTESLEWFHIIPDQSEDEWLKILLHTDGLDPEVKKAFFTLDLLESKKAPESIKHLINEGFFDKDERGRLDLIKQIIPYQSEDEWLEVLSLTDRLTESVKKDFFTSELLESRKAPESIKKLINDGFFDKEQQERLDLIKQMQAEIANYKIAPEEVVSQQDVILSEAVEQEDEQKTFFEEIKLIDIIEIPLIRPVAVEAYSINGIV